MRKFIFPKLTVLFVITLTLQLAACSGGGGGGGGSSAGGPGSSVKSQLDSQNNNAVTYAAKIEELLVADSLIENLLASVNPTDITAIEAAIRTVEEFMVPLSEEISAAGEQIIQSEQNIQSRSGSLGSARLIDNTVIRTKEVALVTAVAVCFVVLTGVSWVASQANNIKTNLRKKKECGADYNAFIDRLQSRDLSDEEFNSLASTGYDAYMACRQSADSTFYLEVVKADAGVLLSVFGPEATTWKAGKAAIETTSAALDVNNIIVIGTSDDSANNRSTNSSHGGPESFVAITDSNGEFSTPEGNWKLAMFKSGFARFGTGADQAVSVTANQTTTIQADTFPTSEATSDNLKSCGAGGGDTDTGGDTGGDTDTGGSSPLDTGVKWTYSGRGTAVSTTLSSGTRCETDQALIRITLNPSGVATMNISEYSHAIGSSTTCESGGSGFLYTYNGVFDRSGTFTVVENNATGPVTIDYTSDLASGSGTVTGEYFTFTTRFTINRD